ncbi:adenosine receptor A1-like [Acipenser ruthenus]|uniref:adenosine receptor A1-like n=1 Tax=Acipenser ruthenus TaxID=7906 RepID=UPI0015614F87|nr:adenosine receptor A1-like [Acipenser ruthenus]
MKQSRAWGVPVDIHNLTLRRSQQRLTNQSYMWGELGDSTLNHKVFIAVIFPACLVLILFIATGNVSILKVLLSRRCSSRDVTTLAVISLAFSDLGVGLFSLPLLFLLALELPLPFRSCLWLACLTFSWAVVSTLHHLLIAVDRWHIVAYPTRYKSLMTRGRVAAHFTSCWLAGIVVSFLPVMGFNNYSKQRHPHEPGCHAGDPRNDTSSSPVPGCRYREVMDLRYLVYVLFVGCMLLPLLAMSGLYTSVFLKVRAHSQQARGRLGKLGQFYWRQRRMAFAMVKVVSCFSLTKLPFHLLNLALLLCPACTLPFWALPSATLLALCSAAANPFLYFYENQDMMLALQSTLRQPEGRGSQGRGHEEY